MIHRCPTQCVRKVIVNPAGRPLTDQGPSGSARTACPRRSQHVANVIGVEATLPLHSTEEPDHREKGFAEASEHVSTTTGGARKGAPTEFDAAMGHTPAGIVRFLRDSQPKA